MGFRISSLDNALSRPRCRRRLAAVARRSQNWNIVRNKLVKGVGAGQQAEDRLAGRDWQGTFGGLCQRGSRVHDGMGRPTGLGILLRRGDRATELEAIICMRVDFTVARSAGDADCSREHGVYARATRAASSMGHAERSATVATRFARRLQPRSGLRVCLVAARRACHGNCR
jgi:hypothetical protein